MFVIPPEHTLPIVTTVNLMRTVVLSFQCTFLSASEPSLFESRVICGITLRHFVEKISLYAMRIVIKPPDSWLATEMRSQRSKDEMRKEIMELYRTQVQFPSLAEGF